MKLRRFKNVSRQNPLAIQLDTRGADGQFESRNLAPGETCDLDRIQTQGHQVKKLRDKGYLREVPIPKPEPTKKSDEEQTEGEPELASE